MREGELSMDELGRRFVAAFNRRDAEGMVALTDPEIAFHPTSLVGARRVYRGHDELRLWMQELVAGGAVQEARVREIRPLDERRFLLLSEVLVDDTLLSPSAMLACTNEDGLIVEAKAYLSDEELLRQLGRVSGAPAPEELAHEGSAHTAR